MGDSFLFFNDTVSIRSRYRQTSYFITDSRSSQKLFFNYTESIEIEIIICYDKRKSF